jgi:16S rRNA (adenine1518-N6/adenine1519-N6)-dimethyltransferase
VLPPGAFFPPPKVDSSFLRVWPRPTPLVAAGELAGVERVARAAFSKRRKTISNALRGAGFAIGGGASDVRAEIDGALVEAGIDPGVRAETVEPERYVRLARAFDARGWI